MRSIFVFTIAALMILMLIQSCQKEAAENKMRTDDVQMTELTEMDRYLLDFREKMTNTLKSGEMLELEDARWHLSAMLNFAYADANPHHKHFQVDTFYTVFPLTNMMVSMDDINDAFAVFTVDLVNAYQAIPYDNKTLVIVVTEVVDVNNNEAQIRMISTFAYSPTIAAYQFDETDWWYWGVWGHLDMGDGKCGDFAGLEIGKDAAVALTEKANMSLTVPIGRIYYTDEETITVHPQDYAIPYQNHPYNRFSLLFWQKPYPHQPDPEWSCLCPDEMNYYLSNIKSIIMPEHQPEGKVLSNYFIQSDLMPGYSVYWFHMGSFTYGIQHVSATLPDL